MHKLHNHRFQNSHRYAPHYAPSSRRNLEETLHSFIEKQEIINTQLAQSMTGDTTKRLMSSPKCRSVEVINNPARPGSNHKEVNCINYK